MSELTLEHQEVSLGINTKTSSPLSYVALESPLLSKLGIGKLNSRSVSFHLCTAQTLTKFYLLWSWNMMCFTLTDVQSSDHREQVKSHTSIQALCFPLPVRFSWVFCVILSISISYNHASYDSFTLDIPFLVARAQCVTVCLRSS